MGKKQQALINDLAQTQTACDIQFDKITTAVGAVVALNQRMSASNDHVVKAQLESQKNPHWGVILGARNQLKTLIPKFETSLKNLEAFAKEKAKRWLGKSTLKDATTAISDAKAHLTNIKQLVEDSVALR